MTLVPPAGTPLPLPPPWAESSRGLWKAMGRKVASAQFHLPLSCGGGRQWPWGKLVGAASLSLFLPPSMGGCVGWGGAGACPLPSSAGYPPPCSCCWWSCPWVNQECRAAHKGSWWEGKALTATNLSNAPGKGKS